MGDVKEASKTGDAIVLDAERLLMHALEGRDGADVDIAAMFELALEVVVESAKHGAIPRPTFPQPAKQQHAQLQLTLCLPLAAQGQRQGQTSPVWGTQNA